MSDDKGMHDEQAGSDGQPDNPLGDWDELIADGKEMKDAILAEHFPKAFERLKAGVSLARIRANYEKLGAKYSPATFRKKWDVLVKKYTEKI